MKKDNIEPSWRELIESFESSPNLFETKEFKELEEKISNENPSEVYPEENLFFYAMSLFPVKETKVVILGQDPYPNPKAGQAHGLAFSVPKGKRIPRSLEKIYEALKEDLGIKPDTCGNLEHWARQGVLLLNTFLSVKKDLPRSHSGWEKFTDSVIERLSCSKNNLVFLLWGKVAQKKKSLIKGNHHILEAAHPAARVANKDKKGFLYCGHFSETNRYLKENGLTEIKWERCKTLSNSSGKADSSLTLLPCQ
ncbi:MAG: uracil-DNA glycosylase [Candidatus Fibromonas sp.]|jgi:uracil-DNA glycosylase|nr:uracil-DNA glycosylase [Candidatus Fibromonas sp.]